jgi:alkylation response protein AidB-like acyl-CoA dehydrogenase
VDFTLSADEEALRDALRRQLEGRFPREVVRDIAGRGGVDRDRWRELADAGVFALRLSEEGGGVGLGMAAAVLVFEELGRALVPGPLVASHVAAGLIDGAATGDRVVGLAERGGQPLLVEYLDVLDGLLVVDANGVWSVDPGAVSGRAVATPLDPLTPISSVDVLPMGEQLGDRDDARRLRLEATVLSAAVLLGIAGATMDAAVAYAKERVQFDKPIGAFQAVKHLCADMLVRTEMARVAVYAAGVTIDDPVVGDPGRAASVAKIQAGEAAMANAKSAVQVHGGMGFTWEVDLHLYLKRAWVLDTSWGSVAHHAEALGATV